MCLGSLQVSFDAEVDPETREESEKPVRYIILDASGWMFTDTVGLRGIKEVSLDHFTQLVKKRRQ